VGLTTGYCGCTTTFSSWNQDAAAFVVSSADVRLSTLSFCMGQADYLTITHTHVQVVTYLLILFEGITAPLVGFIMGTYTSLERETLLGLCNSSCCGVQADMRTSS
jgi:hypothetical protein